MPRLSRHRSLPVLTDFFNYSLLDATLKEVFFNTETGYWCAAGLLEHAQQQWVCSWLCV